MKNLFICRVAKVLDDAECLQKVGNKPATENACNLGAVCPKWHVGTWKPVILK